MYAVRIGLTSKETGGSYTLSLDVWSTLLALKSGAWISLIGKEIEIIIHCTEAKNLRIDFCRVP